GPGIVGGSTVQGHLAEYRISVLDGSSVLPRHLNKHIDYNVRPAPPAVRADSLATPMEMAVTSDGTTLYVAAFGSGKIGVFDTAFTSSNGEASCSSCHIFGDFDSLAWDLGNPDDVKIPNPLPKKLQTIAQINGTDVDFDFFHPMKGPMTTQTLRGMAHHGAM